VGNRTGWKLAVTKETPYDARAMLHAQARVPRREKRCESLAGGSGRPPMAGGGAGGWGARTTSYMDDYLQAATLPLFEVARPYIVISGGGLGGLGGSGCKAGH
jgi:hypothetical protein